MSRYLIIRKLPGVTKEELDAASYRALSCTFVYDGMEWLESFWDAEREHLTCVYEARSEQDIFEHARRARVPCDEVRPVSLLSPLDYMGGEPRPEEPSAGTLP